MMNEMQMWEMATERLKKERGTSRNYHFDVIRCSSAEWIVPDRFHYLLQDTDMQMASLHHATAANLWHGQINWRPD